jgi:glutathione S-transferase
MVGMAEGIATQVYRWRNATNVIPVLWALKEIGLPYKRHDLGGSFGGLESESFRAMNPNGRIPVLHDGQVVLSESNTIIRYLSSAYGRATIRPRTCQDYACANQWMEWYKTTLNRPFIALFQMFVRIELQARDTSRIREQARAVGEMLRIPDGVLQQKDFLARGDFYDGRHPLGSHDLSIFRPRYRSSVPSRRRRLVWSLASTLGLPLQVTRPFGLTPSAFLSLEEASARRDDEITRV